MAKVKRIIKYVGCIPLLLSFYTFADTVNLPPVSTGNTSFDDGVIGPGGIYEQVFNYYDSSHLHNNSGHSLPGHQKIRVATLLSHAAYITHYRILGAYYGFEIAIPLVRTHLNFDDGPSGTKTQVGDTTISPMMLQWEPVLLFGRPFWQRVNFSFTAPTGHYSRNGSINAGAHLWQFNPHYAFTWELTDRIEFSARIHYAYFGKNKHPADALQAKNIQPGSAWHGNYAFSYAVTPEWRIGVAGYNLRQIHADRINGHRQQDSKAKVWGIGPGVMYHKDKNTVFLNAYKEYDAHNINEGTRINLRLIRAF